MPRDAQLQRDVEGRYVATDATLRLPLPGDLFAAGKPDPRTMCCRNDIWKSPVAEHWVWLDPLHAHCPDGPVLE